MSTVQQKVMVTAAGRGIGRSIAERFHAAGSKVYICCLTAESLEAICTANPGITGEIADVGNSDDVDRWFSDGLNQLGGIDVLINNAGIGGPCAPVEDISNVDWCRTFDVNIHGVFYCSKHATTVMKQQGRGSIINISTASTRVGMPLRTPYIATKSALDGFTKNLARELGPFGIRCNAILPGLVDNERGRTLVARLADKKKQSIRNVEAHYLGHVSMRSFVTTEEIADVAFFLASNSALHISGQLIGVCGNLEWEE